MQSARLKAANSLVEIRERLLDIRCLVCWPDAEDQSEEFTKVQRRFNEIFEATDALFAAVQPPSDGNETRRKRR